jgi:hypothetical protein
MDTTLHAIYDDPRLAQQAAQRLLALGIDRGAIQIMSASAIGVAERDHVGGYADSGEHMHGGERDHVGSFASVAPARRVTPNTADSLRVGGLSPEDTRSYAARVDAGAAVLLVQVSQEQAAQVAEVLQAM